MNKPYFLEYFKIYRKFEHSVQRVPATGHFSGEVSQILRDPFIDKLIIPTT